MARAIVEVEDKWKITNSCQEAPKRKASDGFVYADSIVTDGLTSEIVVLFQKENHRVTLSKDFSEAKKFLLSDVCNNASSVDISFHYELMGEKIVITNQNAYEIYVKQYSTQKLHVSTTDWRF